MRAPLTSVFLRLGGLAACLTTLGACQTQPVRLYELREAAPGSSERAAYDRLEEAVALANEFLATAPAARGFPAEAARFSLDHSDILLTLRNEGIWMLRIGSPGWADHRTAIGDGIHSGDNGFLAARNTGSGATGDGTADSSFLRLAPPEMAAALLRQATIMREMQARGSFDYWLNYSLLGLNPEVGWHEDNAVDRRARAVERGFLQWQAER